MDQFIQKSIDVAGMPAESADVVKSLFESLGVDAVSDVQYVTESDLSSVVKLIHSRKLMEYWKSLRYFTVLRLNFIY